MKEFMNSFIWKLAFRIHPAYRGTGGRITYIAADWSKVTLQIPHNLKTRNYVGSIFGGSMYGAVDPIYMIMLIQRLGRDFIVWDKSAAIRFLKPGRSTLRATFQISDMEIEEIKDILNSVRSIERSYKIDLIDKDGVCCAQIDKTIYIRRK